MSLFLGIDAVAAPRGDGLRPELRALMIRHAEVSIGDEIRSHDALSAHSVAGDIPAVLESHRIPVSGL
jgi:hypothetical protein